VAADPDQGRDSGFTLLEVIVVVLLVAVLSSVMVAVVAVILRNAPSTEARTDDSRSYRRLVIWLPRDVASTPPGGLDFGGGSTMCADAVGASLVQLTWTPNDDQNITYAADYRLILGGSGSQVTRFTCSGATGAAPYSGGDTLKVTSIVRTAQATPPGSGVGVTMRLTTCGNSQCSVDGPIITVEAGSRNPAAVLS
jgi:prepilin-type N-terminal cleavage/methylation domain-containing protein